MLPDGERLDEQSMAAGSSGKGCKEEELDSLPRSRRAKGRKESWKWVQGETGQVSPCRRFAAHKQAKGGAFATLVPVAAKQLSLRPWRLVALPSSLSLSRRTPASP
jgi:hypothetical protein